MRQSTAVFGRASACGTEKCGGVEDFTEMDWRWGESENLLVVKMEVVKWNDARVSKMKILLEVIKGWSRCRCVNLVF